MFTRHNERTIVHILHEILMLNLGKLYCNRETLQMNGLWIFALTHEQFLKFEFEYTSPIKKQVIFLLWAETGKMFQ